MKEMKFFLKEIKNIQILNTITRLAPEASEPVCRAGPDLGGREVCWATAQSEKLERRQNW